MARHRPPAVGIDFGTTTSLVARRRASEPLELLPIGTTRHWLPSLAGRDGDRLVVGEAAEALTPDRVARSVKRAITLDQPTVTVGTGARIPRDEAVTAILRDLAERSAANGLPLDGQRDLRIGCPAMWGREQRRLLLDLVAAAGIGVEAASLVEEPIAAGLAWLGSGEVDRRTADGRLLVFDMGGGTLDIAVLDIEGGDRPGVRVLASTGLPLGGDALDEAVAEDLTAELGKRDIDLASLRSPDTARAEILRQARAAKVLLSVDESESIVFARAVFGERIPPVRYGRDRLEEVFRPQLEKAEQAIWDALRLARLTHARGPGVGAILAATPSDLAGDVTYVLLAGGMSRMPAVRRRVAELLPGARVFDSVGVAADETVVAGLADTGDADPMNLYRPCFDVTLSWEGDHTVSLYEAYTPLFDPNHVTSVTEPGFVRTAGRAQGVPQHRQGELRVFSPTGTPVNIERIDKTGRVEDVLDRLPVRFGHRDVSFRLYCDGRVILMDGAGHSHTLRVEAWPEIGAVR